MNTIGTFRTYLVHNQLQAYSTADVGWIFGLYLFMAFFSGIQTGPMFDAHGPKLLMAAGSLCLVATVFLLGICESLSASNIIYLAILDRPSRIPAFISEQISTY